MTRILLPSILAAVALAVAPAAVAQTPITGTYTGADGAPVSGPGTNFGGGQNVLFGSPGQTAFYLDTDPYTVAATFTGGMGGMTTGTTGADVVVGGPGGDGLDADNNASVTVLSGAITGGNGGIADGTANQYLTGGNGGDGYLVDEAASTIFGGTFTGGTGAAPTAVAPNVYGGAGGAGININYHASVTILGGDFHGGNGASVGDASVFASDGLPGGGVLVQSGTASIYGGTFTPGTYTPAATHGDRSVTNGYGLDVFDGSATLYGTGFTVNGIPNFSGAVPVGDGTITGTLLDNAAPTTFTYDLLQGAAFNIVAVPAPEPSQYAAFGIGILGLCALALRARRQAAQ